MTQQDTAALVEKLRRVAKCIYIAVEESTARDVSETCLAAADALAALPPVAPAPTHPPNLTDAAEMLWVVVANVSGGDWTQQTPEWREAAARWRDYYFASLPATPEATAPPAPAVSPTPQEGE